MNLGCHLSISKGFHAAAKQAVSIGANTFQFFTRNPRGGSSKEIDPKDIEGLKSIMEANSFGPLLAHAPYTLNMAAEKEDVYDFAMRSFAEDIEKLKKTPCTLYNFHPGSHVGQGEDVGIEKIVHVLNSTLKGDEGISILLEGMSGKGTEIGYSFEHLRRIIDLTQESHLMGVCLDTCHLYSAGYDVVSSFEGVIEEFDRVVGLDRLKALHLNDSMVGLGSRKDRHEKIGKGTIGLDAIVEIVNHPAIRKIPVLLETPNEVEGYREEIALLRSILR